MLADALPERATQWWIVRPRTIFAHRRLGSALIHSVDHLAERALIERAERLGYDVRAVDEALYAETEGGELAVGMGSFDGERILRQLWERLLPPRRRVDGRRGVARVEGRLGRAEVSAAVDSACGVAAWSEGDARLIDRALAGSAARARGPEVSPELVLRGTILRHSGESSEALGPLAARAQRLELTGHLSHEGVRFTLTLGGAFLATDVDALRERVRVVASSTLLRATGASEWASPERVTLTHEGDSLRAVVLAPWAAFDALAELLRGRVSASSSRDPQGF